MPKGACNSSINSHPLPPLLLFPFASLSALAVELISLHVPGSHRSVETSNESTFFFPSIFFSFFFFLSLVALVGHCHCGLTRYVKLGVQFQAIPISPSVGLPLPSLFASLPSFLPSILLLARSLATFYLSSFSLSLSLIFYSSLFGIHRSSHSAPGAIQSKESYLRPTIPLAR